MDKNNARQLLISEVAKEVSQYENEQYWITDKVAFNFREMIKTFRKNYYGIYDTPLDPVTKKEKTWVPLTQTLVDAVRKNIDLDPKDVRFRSTLPKLSYFTYLIRGYLRRWFSRTYFNHSIDQLAFQKCVDGTGVWKTYIADGKIKKRNVDLLNIYIDPTADSIQEAYRFTERVLFTESDMHGMDWENTEAFTTTEDLDKTDGDTAVKKAGEYGDVYESWGRFNKRAILAAMGEATSEADDVEVEAQVVISGIDTGNVLFHYAAINNNFDNEGSPLKPYEEDWYVKIPGRWYGKGIAETVLGLQWWINTVINLRINKNSVAQLGLLKIRRGSKVTQQMLENLVSKGVITLADPERDLQQLQINEAGQSSYEDERVAKQWAQEVTSIFDINLGELPASTSATGAVIQDRQARSAFTLVVEGTEHFIQRWIDRHVLPKLPTQIKAEGYSTFYRDFEDIEQVRERVAAYLVLEAMRSSRRVPSEEEIVAEYERVNRKLERRGDLLFEVAEDIITKGIDTEVFVTNSEIDVGVTVRNLLELRNGLDPQSAAEMTAQALDLLNLKVPQSLRNPQPVQTQTPDVQTNEVAPENAQTNLVAQANTINSEQR